MSSIQSDIYSIDKHIQDCMKEGSQAGHKMEPWQAIRPIANPYNSISFSTDEVSLVYSLKDSELFNQFQDINRFHGSIIACIDLYSKLKNDLKKEMLASASKTKVNGDAISVVSSTWLSATDIDRLRPNMQELDSLILQIIKMIEECTPSSRQILESLHQKLKAQDLVTGSITFK